MVIYYNAIILLYNILCNNIILNILLHNIIMPVPVAERSKTCFYGRSLAGIAGSNPAGGMDGCLF